MWLILIPSFESAAQCSTQQLLNRATFLWRVVPSSVFQLRDMRARITLWTFTWWTELRNLCFLPNYRGLAKFLVTSERNSSKAIADNPSSWKAVHLNIRLPLPPPQIKNLSCQKTLHSWGGSLRRVRTPQKKACFQCETNATAFQNIFPVTVSGIPAMKDPCPCSKAP